MGLADQWPTLLIRFIIVFLVFRWLNLGINNGTYFNSYSGDTHRGALRSLLLRI